MAATENGFSPVCQVIHAAPVAAPLSNAQVVAAYPPDATEGGTFLHIPIQGLQGPSQLFLNVVIPDTIHHYWLPITAGIPFNS